MRPIDSDALKEKLKELEFRCRKMLWSGADLYVEALQVAINMIDSAPTITQPLNAPLTLDELREMDDETDEIADDFISFVTGGIQNAAPYCANMCPECCERPGYCTGYSKECKGFFPKAYRRKPKDVET